MTDNHLNTVEEESLSLKRPKNASYSAKFDRVIDLINQCRPDVSSVKSYVCSEDHGLRVAVY